MLENKGHAQKISQSFPPFSQIVMQRRAMISGNDRAPVPTARQAAEALFAQSRHSTNHLIQNPGHRQKRAGPACCRP
jgi:hypothetical protein